MKTNIEKQIELINQAIEWSDIYNNSVARTDFSRLTKMRRRLKKMRFALEENCSAAVYGESQVGKSYVISSLLSSPDTPFYITDGEKEYSFINQINPSGGSTAKRESTGIITRFTTRCDNPKMRNFVKIQLLTAVDVVLFLSDSYYKDIRIDTRSILKFTEINELLDVLSATCVDKTYTQSYITEDDILDIMDYLDHTIGSSTAPISHSNFAKVVSKNIQNINPERWVEVFSLLWNKNEDINNLFSLLIEQLQAISFNREIYVPFDAVLREKGTLLDISWLDSIFNKDESKNKYEQTTKVYDGEGKILSNSMQKSHLSALIAELSFMLSEETLKSNQRTFLQEMDLLDFPGTRRREGIDEDDIKRELGAILRRGKVSYLFNKYSNSLRINTILFCQDNDQNTQSEIGGALKLWISDNIGETPQDRAEHIANTNRISPFFIVATKFNTELIWTNETSGTPNMLAERWSTRFEKILRDEVIRSHTFDWLPNWTETNNEKASFQSIYMLRDFFWSQNQQIFLGYNEGESREISENKPQSYLHYRKDLKDSFVNHPFIRLHFQNPSEAWDSVATPNNDGSTPIIRDLTKIAPSLDQARKKKYQLELLEINKRFLSAISNYYTSDDPGQKIKDIKRMSGEIRIKMDGIFGKDPAVFSNIIKALMIDPHEIRKITHSIVNNYKETPQETSDITLIRAKAKINFANSDEENRLRLCEHYNLDCQSLTKEFEKMGVNIDDILDKKTNILATQADVITEEIVKLWEDFLFNTAAQKLDSIINQTGHIVVILKSLFDILEVRDLILKNIGSYLSKFESTYSPNIIADSTALILNNFSNSLGGDFMTDAHLKKIFSLAETHQFKVDRNTDTNNEPNDLIEILSALDASSDIWKQQDMTEKDVTILRKLPLFDNFWNFENLLVMGFILSSDMPNNDVAANDAMGAIWKKGEAIKTN